MRRGIRLSIFMLFAARTLGLLAQSAATPSPAASGSGGAGPTQTSGGAAAPTKVQTSWVIGVSRFSAADSTPELAGLEAVLPELILADFGELPPHYISDKEAAAVAAFTAEKGNFAAGSELAARLDDRALRFLDPGLWGDQRLAEIDSADKALDSARTKLDAALHPAPEEPASPRTESLPSALWEGHGRGELIDPASGIPPVIAQSKNLDLLVSGTIHERSGYAEVSLVGYDASLGKNVFAWTGYCSPDDPAPLAASFAHKIEEWAAGRAFARLDVRPHPDSAIVSVDGVSLSAGTRTVYRFSPGPVRLRLDAPGYLPVESLLNLNMGERKSIDVRLDPAKTGTVTIRSSPPDAQISLDSLPKGRSPVTADLDGSRIVATATAPGYEPGTAVLPRSGTADISINLLPSDGLGPGGRVDKAKDNFYRSLGWLVLSIPVTALTAGIENGYVEGANRSGDLQLFNDAQSSQLALGVSAGTTAVLAINAIIHLIIYLGSAR